VTELQLSKSNQEFYGRAGAKKCRGQKVQARSKMAKHKLKPWQRVGWGKKAQTATGIEAQGEKRTSVRER
jgi:hypothetical protein